MIVLLAYLAYWGVIIALAIRYAMQARERRRRRRAGRCAECDYDLRATPGGTCPECGTWFKKVDRNSR